jgi:hypothetical protein
LRVKERRALGFEKVAQADSQSCKAAPIFERPEWEGGEDKEAPVEPIASEKCAADKYTLDQKRCRSGPDAKVQRSPCPWGHMQSFTDLRRPTVTQIKPLKTGLPTNWNDVYVFWNAIWTSERRSTDPPWRIATLWINNEAMRRPTRKISDGGGRLGPIYVP